MHDPTARRNDPSHAQKGYGEQGQRRRKREYDHGDPEEFTTGDIRHRWNTEEHEDHRKVEASGQHETTNATPSRDAEQFGGKLSNEHARRSKHQQTGHCQQGTLRASFNALNDPQQTK